MISEESIPDMDVTPLLHGKNGSNSVLIFREIISKQVMQTLTGVNDYNSIYKTKRIIKIIFDIIYKEFQNNGILYKNVKESLVSEDRVLEFDLVIGFSLIHIKICFNGNKLSIIDKSNGEDILSHIIYNEKNIPGLKIDKVIDKQVDFNY